MPVSEMEDRKSRILLALKEPACRAMTASDLAVWLDVPIADRGAFESLLDEMAGEGAIVRNRRNRYGLAERLGMTKGRYQGNARGFGFVIDEGGHDIYIGPEDGKGAMDGDTVLAKPGGTSTDGKRREGVVVQILERAHHRVVGRFTELAAGGYVTPDSRKLSGDVRIDPLHAMDAKTGQKVVVNLTRWPDGVMAAEGRVLVVLGAETEPGVDILSVLYQNGISIEFPEAVLAEADRLPEIPSESDFSGRRDLRSLPMVTIDGEDARDLDDAVSLERLPDGLYRLGVHIADVSHYVREGSALDREALERGTSVYLPDRVIPMFPQSLSNGLCSLTAQTPRLAFSVTMDVDGAGDVVSHEIFESVLNIRERMTYTSVRALLEDDLPELRERYGALVPMFQDMRGLAAILGERRKERGSIDFSFDESKILVDGEGHPTEIKRVKPDVATNIIEEFMLLCNEVVSEHFSHIRIPFVYRVHEDPDPDKMDTLRIFLGAFGYTLPSTGVVHPSDLQAVLRQVKGKPEEKTVGTMMLRSLQKARYSHEHIWHFGLAAPYYSHFTSPIRRYPDLLIHRIMKETLQGRMDDRRKAHYNKILPEEARQCSERERAADATERECVDMKKAEYMQAHVGETFEGIVSGVAAFGLFVELPDTVEGLVRLSSMQDDYYGFNERNLTLVGEHTGRTWRIGDPMTVLVAKASPELRQIDFVPAGVSADPGQRSLHEAGNNRFTQTSGVSSRMDGGRQGGRLGERTGSLAKSNSGGKYGKTAHADKSGKRTGKGGKRGKGM
jgi:ribonuclease R